MKGKRLHRLVCLVLGILMMFSTLTTAFAGSSWAAPGGGVYGYGAPAGSSWVNSAQFLRVSLYWAPKASAGASGIGEDGADWSSPCIRYSSKRKGIGDLECEKTYPFVSDYSIFSLKIRRNLFGRCLETY